MRQPEIEAMDRGELELLQLERLQSTLTRAYRQVKFYRHQFDRLGLNLEDIRSLSDLSRLPCTTREDLSENYPYGLFAVPLRDIVRILSSPGTTEKPLVVGYTSQDVKLWLELLARLYVASGVTREDILQIILPPGLANWRRDLQAGAEHLGASVIPPASLNFAKELMVMRDYKTSVLVTTPSAGPAPPDGDGPHGPDPGGTEPQARPAGGLAAAPRRCAGRSRPASRSGAPRPTASPRSWGRAWPSVAAPRAGLHFSEDHFYPEIIDPETGAPVPPGAPGELVITTLSTVAFPLVRFRSGDRTSLIQAPCACGRTLVRLGEITGRTDPIFSVGGIKVHPDQIGKLSQGSHGRPPAPITATGWCPRKAWRSWKSTSTRGRGLLLRRNQGPGRPVPPGPAPPARTHLGIEARITLKGTGG